MYGEYGNNEKVECPTFLFYFASSSCSSTPLSTIYSIFVLLEQKLAKRIMNKEKKQQHQERKGENISVSQPVSQSVFKSDQSA